MLIKIVLMAALAALILWQAFRSDAPDSSERPGSIPENTDVCYPDMPDDRPYTGSATRKAPRGRVRSAVQTVALEVNRKQNKAD